MKKPRLQGESAEPRQVQRADLAPATGYAIIVDGHFKTEFDEEQAAKNVAAELLAKYPTLLSQTSQSPHGLTTPSIALRWMY